MCGGRCEECDKIFTSAEDRARHAVSRKHLVRAELEARWGAFVRKLDGGDCGEGGGGGTGANREAAQL